MSKEELLKYLIAEIDLIMHDKDYRFENANGTWYSRESCRDLTNEEVFEELRTELRQLADLEAKLAESEKDKQFYFFENGEKGLKIRELKQQLAEKDKAIENWQTIYESVVQTCHNDKEEIERLNKQLAETEKEIEYQESMKILAVENQNKKAIEQLEQIINLFEPYENEEKDTILCANNGISFLEYIDNQINELKGKVEDVKD